ncbi:phenylacetaldehyde reductase-like [Humulus lupulus]|uniref:phenylacetaldehyde reductase-like n=1 Tax=Humulus lupulus TaxID=3486 RepID=UPI002B408B71|nr:phenylacetaldehyde reductase-like [Humulus lupulus]
MVCKLWKEKMSGEEKVVCVSGASGYIASWLVKFLLQHGYTVKASVRDPNDLKKTKHLVELDGAKERLYLFKADLMEEGSFDSAINGCDGVFHTASPVFHSATDPQAEIIEPAVKGTLNVLKSCAKAPSVKRVIITSSMAAVLINGKPLNPDVVVDETWFSDPVFCENMKIWYAASKARAEKAAWEFAKENEIDLITIHPGVTLGPLLQPTMNDSVSLIMNLTNGPQKFPNRVYSYHDVRDVARAHIQAFEVGSASGRYFLSGYIAHISELLKILQQLYPALTIPQRCENDEALMEKYRVSDLRAKSLGISQCIPLEVSLRDTVESLKEKGLFSI